MAYVAIADRDNEQELHDPDTFITKYVWSQDHKVIAIQYSIIAIAVGLIALVLSGMMRLQLAFPDAFAFIDPTAYYQFITMHGMIMVIYLLTALFLGGFGNYLIPLMVGSRDMVFPFMNMLSVHGHAGRRLGHRANARVAGDIHRRFHDGWFELRNDRVTGSRARHDTDAHAIVRLGHLHRDGTRAPGVPGPAGQRHHDAVR
jgi:hypothetical protein